MQTTKKICGIALALACSLAVLKGQNLYIVDSGNNTIGEYGLDGSVVNSSLISSGLNLPETIAFSGNDLFIVNGDADTIGEYTTSGATVNASLITGLDAAYGFAISGTNLFITSFSDGTVGEYTTSGGTVNASLITGLSNPLDVEISPAQQSPGPQLNIAPFGNLSVLFYPAWATNYVLQSVTNLASTNWLTVTNGVPVIAVTVTNSSPASFFRLAPAD